MILLDMAVTGRSKSGQELPDDVRQQILYAAFLIISTIGNSPYAWGEAKFFPAHREKDMGGNVVRERIDLSGGGVLGRRFEWIGTLRDAFKILLNAATVLDSRHIHKAASELRELVGRMTLMMTVVESVRDSDHMRYAASLLTGRIEKFLNSFSDFVIISTDLLHHTIAEHARKERCISDQPEAWEAVAAAAYDLWDQAEPHAARARKTDQFIDLLEAGLACLPYYEGAVGLFYDAMRRHSQSRGQPVELMRDFRVVEEYRVGAIELLRYLGDHLISRVGLFLLHAPGHPIREAVRRAVNSARAEISVYPDSVRSLWEEAASEIDPSIVLSEQNYWELSRHLEYRVRDKFPSAYVDGHYFRLAQDIENQARQRVTLYLETGWESRLFDSSAPLFLPESPKMEAGTYTDEERERTSLIEQLLSGNEAVPCH